MKRASFTLALICGAQFLLQLDFSIVNVALPAIERELGFAAAELQWVVTGYALTFGSLLLVGGRAADLLGRRALLELGLVLFALASLACGLAQSPLMLIVARFVQGAAGAMVSPAALSLLTTLHREGPERTRALGLWQAATAAGATTGIIAGGLLTQFVGWRAIFLVNPPLIAVMLALVHRLLPAGRPAASQRLDIPGAVLVTTSLGALIFGLSNGQQHGFGAPATIAALAAAVVLGTGFIGVERRAAEPMLPLGIFAAPTRRAAAAAMLLTGAIVAAYVYFISLYLQRVLGFSPVATGLSLVPSTATLVLTTTFGTRRLLQRFGVMATLLGGLALTARPGSRRRAVHDVPAGRSGDRPRDPRHGRRRTDRSCRWLACGRLSTVVHDRHRDRIGRRRDRRAPVQCRDPPVRAGPAGAAGARCSHLTSLQLSSPRMLR
jgi:MFS family permease